VFVQVLRSEELRIETDVRINCSLTERALYNWTISEEGQGQKPVTLTNIDTHIFHDPILFLPALSLHYGTYDVVLKVRINLWFCEMFHSPVKGFRLFMLFQE